MAEKRMVGRPRKDADQVEPRRTISLQLPARLIAKADQKAEAQGISRTEVIKQLLEIAS